MSKKKVSNRTPFLSEKLGKFDASLYQNTKVLTKEEKELLLLYNVLAYEQTSVARHIWWLKHIEYLPKKDVRSRNTKGTATNRNFKDNPEYLQFFNIEKYLFNEFMNLKYGGVKNQGNYCLDCECCYPYQQGNGIAYKVNNEQCKKWSSLRWCPLLKQIFDNDRNYT